MGNSIEPIISVRLFLLGAPRIERNGENIELGLRKAVALIAYLAVTRQPQSRDFLATLLWPESDPITAHSNLRRALYRIHHALGEGFLLASPETMGIAPGADLRTDVQDFDESVAGCLEESMLDKPLSRDCRTKLEGAATLYADDFMKGFSLPDSQAFEEWQFFEQERLRKLLSGVLVQLANAQLREGDPTGAIPNTRRWLALDPLHEPAHRLLMELYSRSGQRSAALRQYQECARLLKESLGLKPDTETTRLYEAVQKGKEDWHQQKISKPVEINYVQSGDVHIAYQVVGSGPVDLLIVHGWISHLEHNLEGPGVMQAFNRLASFSRLISFDKRGVGLSDRVGYPPTLEHTMDDARSVLDAVASKHAVLFGYSEGGPASLMFCATYPERVSGLILYGTMAKATRTLDYPLGMPEAGWNKWMNLFLQFYGKPVPHAYFAPSYAEDKELWEWFARLMRLGSSPGEVQRVFEVLKDIDVRAVLPVIRVPTLVMHRQQDQAFRIEAGRYLAEKIRGARFVELPGQDHWWWLGNSEEVINEIESFIANIKPAAYVERTLITILCMGKSQEKVITTNEAIWLDDVFRREVAQFKGKLVKMDESYCLAAFDGPSRAIRCGIMLSQAGARQNVPLRVALHTGECILTNGELHGAAKDIAISILEDANENEVLVTRTVKDLVVGAGFEFESREIHRYGEKLGDWELFTIA